MLADVNVDDPGAQLGVARLVHVGAPPDMSRIPIPEMVVPPKAFSQDVDITIPFISLDNASNDDDFDNGSETSLGWFDSPNHIQADIQQGPVRCEQSTSSSPAWRSTRRMPTPRCTSTSRPSWPIRGRRAYTFTVHLDHVNFGSQNSLHAKATLNWEPVVDQTAIDAEGPQRLAKEFLHGEGTDDVRTAFLTSPTHASSWRTTCSRARRSDLRTEERTVVYRRLIQDMLTPSALVPQPDAQTQHVVAELLDSIFDVDKMLYFVSPGLVAPPAAPQSRRGRRLRHLRGPGDRQAGRRAEHDPGRGHIRVGRRSDPYRQLLRHRGVHAGSLAAHWAGCSNSTPTTFATHSSTRRG